MKKPKAPKKTAQEVAVERRQTIMLDKEIEEQEDRFRALSRGKLGRASLLAGAPRTRGEAAGRGGTRSTTAGGTSGGTYGGTSGGIASLMSGFGGSYTRPSSPRNVQQR